MASKRPHSPGPEDRVEEGSGDKNIYASDSIHDRSSIFVAHYSPDLSAKSLQDCIDFKSASHRIAGWRSRSKQKLLLSTASPLFQSGFDDDGEKYAGKKLVKVLEEMNVEGAVVVARWYGGVLLGPVRFKHIENCAKQAVRKYLAERSGPRVRQVEQESTKRQKVDASEKERERLTQELPERDESISALRKLLADTKGDSASSTADGSRVTPTKSVDYGALSIEALRRLERARDATIAFLLRSIDEAEKASSVSQLPDVASSEKEERKPS
jgi:putative IMPACT (imprinted ancient) family translation regulator